jgi:hypothetical protein
MSLLEQSVGCMERRPLQRSLGAAPPAPVAPRLTDVRAGPPQEPWVTEHPAGGQGPPAAASDPHPVLPPGGWPQPPPFPRQPAFSCCCLCFWLPLRVVSPHQAITAEGEVALRLAPGVPIVRADGASASTTAPPLMPPPWCCRWRGSWRSTSSAT